MHATHRPTRLRPSSSRPLAAKVVFLALLGVAVLSFSRGGSGGCGGNAGGSGAAANSTARPPQPLLMLMSSRSGSSLMTEALNLHPRILFVTELFNNETDWHVGTTPRAEKFYQGRYRSIYERYQAQNVEYTMPDKAYDQLRAVGFKLRPLEAGVRPGSEGWRVLERVRPKIICSHRRSQVKGSLSHLRALELKVRCGTPNVIQRMNCSLPADWVPSVDEFKQQLVGRIHEAQQFIDLCQQAAGSFHTMFIAYEDLLADMPGTIERILRFVGMPAADAEPFMAKLRSNSLPIGVAKNTPDNLAELLPPASLQELRSATEEVYASEGAATLA